MRLATLNVYWFGLLRQALFDAVAAWLAAPPADYDGPYAALLGDFNSLAGRPETAALRAGALAAWTWQPIEFEPAGAARWTTRTDREVIDHILLSPALEARRRGPAVVLAFDEDPRFASPEQESDEVWKRTTDHRPVLVDLEL